MNEEATLSLFCVSSVQLKSIIFLWWWRLVCFSRLPLALCMSWGPTQWRRRRRMSNIYEAAELIYRRRQTMYFIYKYCNCSMQLKIVTCWVSTVDISYIHCWMKVEFWANACMFATVESAVEWKTVPLKSEYFQFTSYLLCIQLRQSASGRNSSNDRQIFSHFNDSYQLIGQYVVTDKQ